MGRGAKPKEAKRAGRPVARGGAKSAAEPAGAAEKHHHHFVDGRCVHAGCKAESVGDPAARRGDATAEATVDATQCRGCGIWITTGASLCDECDVDDIPDDDDGPTFRPFEPFKPFEPFEPAQGPLPKQPHDPSTPAGPCVMCRRARPAGSPYCAECYEAAMLRQAYSGRRAPPPPRPSHVGADQPSGDGARRQSARYTLDDLFRMFGAFGAGMFEGINVPRPRPAACGCPWRVCSTRSASVRASRVVMDLAPHGPLTIEIVKARRRELALAHHPDRVGDGGEKMARINAAADELLELLGSA